MAQTALEAALQEFPASLERSERWRAVARRVGRPLNDCVSRYQELRQVQLFPLLLSFCCFSFAAAAPLKVFMLNLRLLRLRLRLRLRRRLRLLLQQPWRGSC